jgi:hypothetical protein
MSKDLAEVNISTTSGIGPLAVGSQMFSLRLWVGMAPTSVVLQ